jgi:hypothetical protein
VNFFNSVVVLDSAFVGRPSVALRVLATWGEHARLDSGEITERVFVAVNEDGADFAVFRLADLLRPHVDCIVTEHSAPVIYLSYGLPDGRRHARVEVSLARLQVTHAVPRC